MIIIKLKDDTYFTDTLSKNGERYSFETTTKAGKIQKHDLLASQVVEIIEQEGTVENSRKPKEV